MVAVNDPSGSRTAELVWRYSLYMAPLPLLAAGGGITSWMFAAEGMVLNGYFLSLAHKFKAHPNPANSHKVFMASLWYLPVILGLMIFHKKSWADHENKETQVEGEGQWRETMTSYGGNELKAEGDADNKSTDQAVEEKLSTMIEGAKTIGRSVCVHEKLTNKDGFCPKVATDTVVETVGNVRVEVEVKTGNEGEAVASPQQ
jgi:protoheme IX farnesyltransferase